MRGMVEASRSLARLARALRRPSARGLLVAAALFSSAAPADESRTGAAKDTAAKEGAAKEGATGDGAAAAGVSLTVRVSQLESDRGRVAVALFASSKDFPDQKRAYAGQLTKISGGRASVTFANVRPGVYAVAVLHDENENEKMDFNFLGMPLEGYGFSNDAAATFGPPSFGAASFKLAPRNSYIPVKMRYFP